MSYSHAAGTTGTVTVPAGKWVYFFTAKVASGGAAGSITITPAGGSAQDAIGIDAGDSYDFTFPSSLVDRPPRLGEGSTLLFTGTSRYVVVFA